MSVPFATVKNMADLRCQKWSIWVRVATYGGLVWAQMFDWSKTSPSIQWITISGCSWRFRWEQLPLHVGLEKCLWHQTRCAGYTGTSSDIMFLQIAPSLSRRHRSLRNDRGEKRKKKKNNDEGHNVSRLHTSPSDLRVHRVCPSVPTPLPLL